LALKRYLYTDSMIGVKCRKKKGHRGKSAEQGKRRTGEGAGPSLITSRVSRNVGGRY